MSPSTTTYRVNTPNVAAEDINDEIVVVSFDSGRYYSMRSTAADMWRLLDAGFDLATIAAHFQGAESVIKGAVDEFVGRLVEHGLVVESAADSPVADIQEIRTYEVPVLEEFDEMKEMLLYDPIHDVDETGWPHLPEASLNTRD